jgi:pimeloyl-ACP methyl ester carboxylesterase
MRKAWRWLWRSVAVLLVVVAVGAGGFIAWHWAPDRPVSALAPRWGAPPSRFEPIAGLTLHLRDEGPRDADGGLPPLVLLHGTGDSLHTWQGWTDALVDGRRVVRYDLPGFGLTGPDPAHDYSMHRQVEVLVAVLDHLGIERAVVGGNSYGGAIAWQAALAHPGRVAGLVLVDTAGVPPPRPPLPADAPPTAPPVQGRPGRSVPLGFQLARQRWAAPLLQRVLPRWVIESSLRNVYGDPSRVTPALVDRYFDLATREGNRAALMARFGAPGRAASDAPASAITQPTLILWGGRDRLIPPYVGERFHAAIAGSSFVLFDDLGHVPHEEDPAATLVPLRAFLDALPVDAPVEAAPVEAAAGG